MLLAAGRELSFVQIWETIKKFCFKVFKLPKKKLNVPFCMVYFKKQKKLSLLFVHLHCMLEILQNSISRTMCCFEESLRYFKFTHFISVVISEVWDQAWLSSSYVPWITNLCFCFSIFYHVFTDNSLSECYFM